MSKPVKELIRKSLVGRFKGLRSLAVIGFVGLDAIQMNQVRNSLRAKDIRLTVVQNSLARQAFEQVGLPQASKLLEGPCAVVYGGDSVIAVIRDLLDLAKGAPALIVKAALLDGEVFGSDRIMELSKYPTREEAISIVVAYALAPGGRLVACLLAPGGVLSGALKTIEEKLGKDADQAESPAPDAPDAPAGQDAPDAPAGQAPSQG